MASGARYRYKGHFISGAKAARIANLKNAKKFLTTEYTFKGRADAIRKGYLPEVEKLVIKALKKAPPVIVPKGKEGKAKRKAERREEEERHIRDIALQAVEMADEEDIDIADAFDALFDPDEFHGWDYDDALAYAEEAYEEGSDIFSFDMADLENEDRYKS